MKYFALYDPEWKKYWYAGICYADTKEPVHSVCDWGEDKDLASTHFLNKEDAEVVAKWFNHEYVKLKVGVVEVANKSKERVLH